MALWYVDNSVPVSGNGTSWAQAWQGISNIAGIAAGDTVYFSGGPTSATQIYQVPAAGWAPIGGTAGNPITYSVGQDTQHNGMVWFKGNGTQQFLINNPQSNVTFSGYYGVAFDSLNNLPAPGPGLGSAQHMAFGNSTRGGTLLAPVWDSNYDACVNCSTIGQSNNLVFSYIYAPAHTRFIYLSSALNGTQTGLQIDHCWLQKVFLGPSGSINNDTFYLSGQSGGSAFTDSGTLITRNYINTEISDALGSPDLGDDVVKWGRGFDFSYNRVHCYRTSYQTDLAQSPEHADVFQNFGSFIRVYSNWFENIGESIFFHNPALASGGNNFTDIIFCNNVITQTFPGPGDASKARGLDIFSQDATGGDTYTRLIITNNTICVPQMWAMRLGDNNPANVGAYNTTWTACRVQNNIFFNCLNDPGNSSSNVAGIWAPSAITNVQISNNYRALIGDFLNLNGFGWDPVNLRITGPVNWLDFQPGGLSPAIDAGTTSPSTIYAAGSSSATILSTDLSGNTRGSAWSIGAFEVSSSTPQILRLELIIGSISSSLFDEHSSGNPRPGLEASALAQGGFHGVFFRTVSAFSNAFVQVRAAPPNTILPIPRARSLSSANIIVRFIGFLAPLANVPFISSSQAAIAIRIQAPNIVFPLKISPNARYFVDQINRPVFLLGDSAWALLANASPSDRLLYLQTRAGQGFNAVLIAPFADKYIWGNINGTCQSFEGQIPFTPTPTLTSAILTSRVETYWQLVDTVIDQANSLSMAVILAVAETGPAGSGGWNTIWNNTSVADAQNYGSFLGNRYKNKLNVMWLLGNDYQNWPGIDSVLTAFAGAIRAAAPNQLMSWELDYQLSTSSNDTGLSTYTDFSWVYTYFPTYQECYWAYQSSPTRPLVLGEAVYEQETIYGNSVVPVSTQVLRLQVIWMLTSGACGHFYGSIFTDKFTAANWQTSMTQPGSTQLINLVNLIKNYSWWLLAPDTSSSHNLITAGYGTPFTSPSDQTTSGQNTTGAANTVIHTDGTPNAYVTGAVASDGSFGLCALPAGGTITVDLTKFSGPVTARWYDATNNTYTAIGSGLTGSQSFTAPSAAPPPPSGITPPAATYFVSQSGTGNLSGSDANNTAPMTSFNNHNFGTVPSGGVTAQFSGTITSQVVPFSSGNANGSIYLDFRNAVLQTSTTGISLSAKSYLVIMGGWFTGSSNQLITFNNVQSNHIILDGWLYNAGAGSTNTTAFIDIHYCAFLTISNFRIDNCGGFIAADGGGTGTNYTGPSLNDHILVTACYAKTNQNTITQTDVLKIADGSNITIEKCHLINDAPADPNLPANDKRHNDILQTYMYGGRSGAFPGHTVYPHGYIIRYNWLERNQTAGSGDDGSMIYQFMADGSDGTPALKVYSNLFTSGVGAGTSYCLQFDLPNGVPWSSYLFGNTWYRDSTGYLTRVNNDQGAAVQTLWARNNLASGRNDGGSAVDWMNESTLGAALMPPAPNQWDYNFFFNSGNVNATERGTHGQSSNTVPTFVIFKNIAGNDFSLDPASPLIGKGDNSVVSLDPNFAFGIQAGSTWPNAPGTLAAPIAATAPPTIISRGTGAWDPGAFVSGGTVSGGGGGNSAGQPDFILVLALTTSPAIRPHLTAAASSGTTIGTKRILRPLLTLRQIN